MDDVILMPEQKAEEERVEEIVRERQRRFVPWHGCWCRRTTGICWAVIPAFQMHTRPLPMGAVRFD